MAMNQKVRPAVVDAVIINEGKILLSRRDTDPYRGYWVLPGGFVEMNETTEQAAVREAKEETGIKIEVLGIIGVYSDKKRDPRQTVSTAYLAKMIGGKLKPKKGENLEVKWFSLNSLPKLGFDHEKMISDMMKVINGCNCADCSGH